MRNLVLLLTPSVLFAAEGPDFVRDVQPILTAHCAGCHNADEAYSGFRVDAFEHVSKPITSEDALQQGPSLTPGVAETSRLYRLMAGLDSPRMPPEEDADAVPADQLAVVKAWIDAGAKGPSGMAVIPTLVVPKMAANQRANVVTFAAAPFPTRSESRGIQYALRGTVSHLAGSRVDTAFKPCPSPGKVNDIAVSKTHGIVVAATGVTGLRGELIVYQRGFDADVRTDDRLHGHRDTIQAVDISPDGSRLVTGSYDRELIIWDLKTGEKLRTLRGHNGAVFDVAFSPNGQLVASASADETVKVWNASTGKRLDTMPQPEGEVNVVFFSSDGRSIYAASSDNRIRKWKLKSLDQPAINPLSIARFAHEGPITHMVATDDGQQIVTASTDRTVKVWTADDLTLLATFGPLEDVVSVLRVDLAGTDFSPEPEPAAVAFLMDGSRRRFTLPTSAKPATRIGEVISPVFMTDVGSETAVEEAADNGTPSTAQALTVPARVTGAIESDGEVDFYSFAATRGEQWVIEVEAARGSIPANKRSRLDSVVEVLDADGGRIERVVLQAIRDSYFTFRGKNSTQTNDYRVFNWQEMELGDLFYANGEVSEFYRYPAGPDSGFTVYPGFGNRHLRFDTTGVVHALGDPAYVVKPFPPGSEIAPNGLPTFPIYFSNDDDASRRHGKDSVVSFTAPRDGQFIVRVSDARFQGSADHRYALRVRPRTPDFRLSVATKADKVAPGSASLATIRITRIDGFEGPVSIAIENLPAGFKVPQELTIERRQHHVEFPVFIDSDASTPTAEELKAVTVVATAESESGEKLAQTLSSFGKLEVSEKPAPYSLEITAPVVDGLPTIDLKPGETTSLLVKANRGSFKGRIQFGKQDAGRNLPFAVFVDNIGLNGLMIPAGQSEQEFFVTAAPVAEPQERLWFLHAGEGGGVASNLVRVRIRPAEAAVAAND